MPTTNPDPAALQAALFDQARHRYERDVASVAAKLRAMADDVERRGARLGSALLGQAPYQSAAGYVVMTVTGLHNLHLGDLVSDAAEADRYHPELHPATTGQEG